MIKSLFQRLKTKPIIACLLIISCLLGGTIASAALSFNGNTSAGGSGGSISTTAGYSINYKFVDGNVGRVAGFRFSVVNSSGAAQKTPLDLIRNATCTADGVDYGGTTFSRLSPKLNKTVLKATYAYTEFTLSTATDNVKYDTDLSVSLPEYTTGIENWTWTTSNVSAVLGQFGYEVSDLTSKGWSVLIEPIYPLTIEGNKCAFTPTEIAAYGASKFGIDTTIVSSTTQNTWGFIAEYTNKQWPNSMRLANDQLGLAAVGEASTYLSFRDIIEKGYGAVVLFGVGSGSDDDTTYTITYDANGGSGAPPAETSEVGYPLTISDVVPTKDSYVFLGWNTKTDSNGDWYYGGDLYTDNSSVTLYAQWDVAGPVGAYVDGGSGDDGNSGANPTYPVMTLAQAYTNLKDTGGIIYVVGTVYFDYAGEYATVTSTYYEDEYVGRINIADGKSVTIRRYAKPTSTVEFFDVNSYVGVMFDVNSGVDVTISDIIIDGHKNVFSSGSITQNADGVIAEGSMFDVSGVLTLSENSFLRNNNNYNNNGGAVLVKTTGKFNLQGGTIQNNNAKKGAGVYNEGTLNLIKGSISSNVAYWKSGYMVSGNGGGVYSAKSFSLPKGVFIENNFAVNGGGVFVYTDDDTPTEEVSVLTLEGAEITGNSAGDGAGAYVSYSKLIMKSGKISRNNAGDSDYDGESYGYGGGISVSGDSRTDRGIVTVLGGEISHNTAISSYGAYGAGIYSHWATVNIDGGLITNNSCSGDGYSTGGGVFLNERSVLNMTGGTISKNSAEEGGGVGLIYYYDSTANFSGNAVVTENTATCGGGVYNYGCGDDGGGIYVDGNARIDNNSAKWGGGIYCDYGHATITGGSIQSNSADYGGGVYLCYESVLTLTSNSIYHNTAKELGSGVYVSGAGEYNDISTFKMYDAACVGDTNRDGVSDTDEVYLEDGCYIWVPSAFNNVSTDSSITTGKKALRAVVVPSTTDLGRVIAKFGDESSTEGKKALYWNSNTPKMSEQYFVVKGEVLRSGDQGASDLESIGVTLRDVFISRAYKVEYNANGGSNAPAAQTKFWNEPLTLSSSKPSYASRTFIEWNTAADGEAKDYTPGATYTTNEELLLYAIWELGDADGLGYKTIRVGDVVVPGEYLDEFEFPADKEVNSFKVVYNGVPRDGEEKATTPGTGYTIVYLITFTDDTEGDYRLIVTVLDNTGPTGYIRFISYDYLNTLQEKSKWRLVDVLKDRLEATLSKNPSDENAQQVWHFDASDIQDIKEWVDESDGAGKTREEQNAEFSTKFGGCKTKG